jgi:hypothetical protein
VKKVLSLAFAIFMAFIFSGCAGKDVPGRSAYVEPATLSQADTALTQDEAAIVFFRPVGYGFAGTQAPIAEFINNNLRFVTILTSHSKVFYKTTPGKHTFVVGGRFAELLEAELEGGKTYYVYVIANGGNVKAVFTFEPVSAEETKTEKFIKDFGTCSWNKNVPNIAELWFAKNKPSMERKYIYALKEHQSKPTGKKNINEKQQVVNSENLFKEQPKIEYKKIILPEYGI